MQKRILTWIIVFTSVFVLICSITFLQRWLNFKGVSDEKVLPLLKNLPATSERGNISARDGRMIYKIVVEKNYRRGLELGTSNGYSALWQGLAFRKTGGSLITVEIDTLIGSEARRNFKQAGLDDIIDLRINDAFLEIKNLRDSLDYVFLDTGEYNPALFKLVLPIVKKGGCLVMHNVHKNDEGIREIISSSNIKTTFKKRLFYNIMVSTII